jgi:nucleoside phosphorylase/5'-deoxynucleotidase YfbR-like HD superfamily hydrolase
LLCFDHRVVGSPSREAGESIASAYSATLYCAHLFGPTLGPLRRSRTLNKSIPEVLYSTEAQNVGRSALAHASGVDVLLIVALPEEALAFQGNSFFPLAETETLEAFRYRKFSFLDVGDTHRVGLFLTVGEVGSKVRDATVLFATHFRPKIVLSVGISGRVGTDARVGDIVVPAHINIYDFRSATQDDNAGGYLFNAGGKPANVSANARSICNAPEFAEKLHLQSLDQFCAGSKTELSSSDSGKIAGWVAEGLMSSVPRIIEGPFAVGSSVNKSQEFKRQVLLKTDRNILAVDMESGFVADAVQSLDPPPQFFSIRAISDPATAAKKDFDAVSDGAVRRWAMSSIVATVGALVAQPTLYGSQAGSLARPPRSDNDDGYLSDYPGQRISDAATLEDFDRRFSNLRCDRLSTIVFSDFVEAVRRRPENGRFLVRGRGGAGKSAFLMKAKMEIGRDTSLRALFLNMRNLLDLARRMPHRTAVHTEISKQAQSSSWPEPVKHVVFVDELYGEDEEKQLLDELVDLLKITKPTLVFAFGVDHFEISRIASETRGEPYVYGYVYDLEVSLKSIAINDDRTAADVIDGLIRTSGTENVEITDRDVMQRLRALGFLYINHFVISLYLNNFRKLNFSSVRTATVFINRAMEALCSDLYGRKRPATGFDELCVEAFRSWSSELAKEQVPEHRREINRRYKESFAHFPRIVQTSMIAHAVVHILSRYSSSHIDVFKKSGVDQGIFLSIVFANDVNSAIKDLLADERIENLVLDAAASIYETLEPRGLSYAIYLFGRARSVKGKRRAQEFFDNASRLLIDGAPRHVGSLDTVDDEIKFERLARRSLYISRSLNGDRKATEAYISEVLEDPVEDRLNRGFHLEYYGDHLGTGISVKLELDDSGGAWKHTRQVIGARIEAALVGGILNEYDRICILTYFSLVRYRHELNTLGDHRDAARAMLTSVLSSGLNLGIQLSAFLSGLAKSLERPTFTGIEVLLQLYVLKGLPRAGWTKRGFGALEAVETVASHVYGAMLIADILLPILRPLVTDDERRQVGRLLLYHDLAESYIGDYIPTDGETKSKEEAAVNMIAGLSMYKRMTALSSIRQQWTEYEQGQSRACRLARDFDKLDAVLQATVYADRFADVQELRRFFDYHLERILDPELRSIAEEALSMALKRRFA